ncbi:FxLD family lanthipeptide [Mangrovactinospora gilvigrisea]|uniref:FxLD family lanthipeptide n=1 Tax=Mangrovactinospora gilvigrisea TaxID=1428644 RepID=UPI0009A0CC81|nr:FxLD family lanthipeptide [Mangrovactinospora gilvigrisea]
MNPTTNPPAESDFDLDITVVRNGATIAELMNSTSDGCGSSNSGACVTCIVE